MRQCRLRLSLVCPIRNLAAETAERLRLGTLRAAAGLWRRLLWRTTFIAITGSFGKTTAKDLIAAALSLNAPTAATAGNWNGPRGVCWAVLKTRPWHRYSVVEIGTAAHGAVRAAVSVMRPRITVFLRVGKAHLQTFRTLENVAGEKAWALRRLPADGLAVLNSDDPHVMAAAALSPAPVVWFGSHPESVARRRSASSAWPERLTLEVDWNGRPATLRTRLVGTHWEASVLAALAVAGVCGAPRDAVLRRFEEYEPFTARLQPVQLPSGAVLLRDEYNGTMQAWQASSEVLRQARAERRILVTSDATDHSAGGPAARYKKFARFAAGHCDLAVFLGSHARAGAAAAVRFGMHPDAARAFDDLFQAAAWLRAALRPGDLVLLRGRQRDKLARLYLELIGTVGCRLPECDRQTWCDVCPDAGFTPGVALVSSAERQPQRESGT